jgi:hypothetical protein
MTAQTTAPTSTQTSTQTTAPPPTPTLAPDPSRVRASDAEREQAVARVHHALGEGRLSLAEAEERSAAAYAAQYRDELPPLLTDLPPSGAGPASGSTDAPAWTPLWVSVVWRARIALWGAGDRPTAAQCRTGALLLALAVLWTVGFAFLGAGLVG